MSLELAMDAGAAFVYSREQVAAWLERIGLPRDFYPSHEPGEDLKDLTKIQQAWLATIPFENAEMHYSEHHNVTLDAQRLYDRTVTRRLGGYCMQGNYLFANMARSLGFMVYPTGVRVKSRVNGLPTGPWSGLTHQVNIFTLSDGSRVATDVAFGGDGPVMPLPMEHGCVVPQIGERRSRLVKRAMGTNPNSSYWFYQIQVAPDGEWYDVYCFSEVEFFPQDFDVMSYWTSTNAGSWMKTKFVCVRMIMEDGEIVGKYTVDKGTVKKIKDGKSELIVECRTEEERLDILEKYFALVFTDEEKKAIRNTAAELRA